MRDNKQQTIWYNALASLIIKVVKLDARPKKDINGGYAMSRSSQPVLNEDKYKNALIYFVSHCNNKWLGSTKLNKLMYYFDFVSYRDNGKSATGDSYTHLDKGPVPAHITQIIHQMKHAGQIDVEEVPYMDGKKDRFSTSTKPDMDVFTDYESKLLQTICTTFKDWQTSKIVDQTHFESPWLYSEPYDEVDYEYAYDIDIIPDLKAATGVAAR